MQNKKPKLKSNESEKDFSVIYSKQVKEKLKTAPPKVQEKMRDLAAIMRQAMQGVKEGRYKSFDDAMWVLTGVRPKRIEDD